VFRSRLGNKLSLQRLCEVFLSAIRHPRRCNGTNGDGKEGDYTLRPAIVVI
jgi:hypothetical protein